MKKYYFLLFCLALIIITGCCSGNTFVIKEINLELVKCPAGSFMMGSPKNELGRPRDGDREGYYISEILHLVSISKPFYIGKYEITQSQYSAIMERNPSEFVAPNNPVERVSWEDAKEFIDKLNLKYLSLVPQGYRFDLPTEAQWEYACRAGTNTAFNNGKNLSNDEYDKPCSNLDEVAWYQCNASGTTHAVGQKKPNPWGIYDMHGNVAEWCKDYLDAYSSKDAIDPLVEKNSDCPNFHIFRGGASTNKKSEIHSIDYKSNCRSAKRFFPNEINNPILRESCIGIRVALVPIN